jgi:hypothetical protein
VGEAIAPVRRNEPAHLQHDLVAVAHRQAAGITALPHPVQVDPHCAAEGKQPGARERLSPHGEEVAERRPALDVDDTCGIERPEPRSAMRAHSDLSGHDRDAAAREELEMEACAGPKRRRRASRMDRRSRVVLRPHADRGRYKHVLHGIALLAVLCAAGCGGSGGSPTIAVQPARQYRLDTLGFTRAGSHHFTFSFRIVQPDGKALTRFRRGAGPHTGVHVIYIRRDLGEIVHHHPPVAADGSVHDSVGFPAPGPYRVVIDVYPQQVTPQPNFQLFSSVDVSGRYAPKPLPAATATQVVDGYRFTLHGRPRLRAIEAGLLSFTVTKPDGSAARFTPWYGALAHAIFFRKGSLDYFHTHVCAPGAAGCTSVLGGAKVTGSSSKPGQLSVGVLVPVPGTWRLFLQCRADGHVLTAPFTLRVR